MLAPAGHQAPHRRLLAQSPQGDGKWRFRRVKVRKLVDWNKDSLIGQVKAPCTSKAKGWIHPPLLMGRKEHSPLQDSRAPSGQVTWEDKHHLFKYPPLPTSSPSLIYWAWFHRAWTPLLVSWGQLSKLCPLPCAPPACSLLRGWTAV